MNTPFTPEQMAAAWAEHEKIDFVAAHARLSEHLRVACTPDELKRASEPYDGPTTSFEEFFDKLEREHWEGNRREVST